MSRLKEQYQNEIVDAMIKKFGYKNIMEVPKLDKIVVNMGVGEAKENAKVLEAAIKDMETITGQKAVATKAKNAIANFKIRENMPIGCKTTLRANPLVSPNTKPFTKKNSELHAPNAASALTPTNLPTIIVSTIL